MRFNSISIIVFAAAFSLVTLPAMAAPEIIAEGFIDLDGDSQREQFDREAEPDPAGIPFSRSLVSIARSVPGVYGYSASSDIGNLELRVFGEANNATGDVLSNIEIGILSARAVLEDVITLESTLPGDYDVTFALDVDGTLSTDSGSSRAFAQVIFDADGTVNAIDTGVWDASGTIDETLSVTRTFNGTVDADIRAQLIYTITEVNPGGIVTGSLNNTANLRLILPQGVSVGASESGTFMQVIPSVPVPAALPLMLLALGALGWGGRRRAV